MCRSRYRRTTRNRRAPGRVRLMGSGIAIDGRAHQALVQTDCLFASVQLIVSADITRQLGLVHLVVEGMNDTALNKLTSLGIDGMGYVSMELGSAMIVTGSSVFLEAETALVAEAGPQMVLAPAAATTVGQLAAGHGDKESLEAFDDFQVSHHEHVVERHGTESEQSFVAAFLVVHELDADFGDLHSCPP